MNDPRVFFTSDLHFGHTRILEHCPNRPFKDMDDQDDRLVEAWNAQVTKQDRVFVLGDFSYYAPAATSAILLRLNGQKTLIKGNHDHTKDNLKVKGWNRIIHYHEEKIEDDRIVLHHFPILSWHQMHRGAYHLHGHSHGSLRYPDSLANARIFDVGIDHTSKVFGHWGPVTWDDIKSHLAERTRTTVDHHTVKDKEGGHTEDFTH